MGLRSEVLLLGAVVACGGDSPEGSTLKPLDTGYAVCSDVGSWSTVGAPFVVTWCAPCHSSDLLTEETRGGAPVGVDIQTYADVVRWEASIRAWALTDSPLMPPTGGPSSAERERVEAWMDCGMPE